MDVKVIERDIFHNVIRDHNTHRLAAAGTATLIFFALVDTDDKCLVAIDAVAALHIVFQIISDGIH